jgi:tRNA(fMet)-specific endonuclease VapC
VILDTNALSAISEAEPGVVAMIANATLVAIPVIVLGEYRFGIAQSRHRLAYERWLSKTLTYCEVLPVGDDTAERYAEIRLELKHAGTPIPSNDVWIAALCRQHSLPVVSQDRHFDFVKGIRRVNWER